MLNISLTLLTSKWKLKRIASITRKKIINFECSPVEL